MNRWVLAAGACSEPWRLWTCHAVHFGLWNALLNLGALAVPFVLAPARLRGRMALVLLLVAPVLSLAILASLEGGAYRGASGLACSAWAMAGIALAWDRATRWEGVGLLALLAVKILAETYGKAIMPGGAGWVSLPAAHRWGAALGALAFPLLRVGRTVRATPR